MKVATAYTSGETGADSDREFGICLRLQIFQIYRIVYNLSKIYPIKYNNVSQLIDALIKARKAKGLSQIELGRRLGVPQSYISRLESGRVDIRLSNLVDFGRFLELELLFVPISMAQSIRALSNVDSAVTPLYTLDSLDAE